MLALPDLRLGRLAAEGGEGRVFELESEPEPTYAPGRYLFKQFRHPRPAGQLAPVMGYPASLRATCPDLWSRVASASAWPVAAVAGDDPDEVVGTVMPRAPSAFWLSHRDGLPRLATLSYLAGDPDRIELAYGVGVPGPGSVERVAVVYALARLLDAWQPAAGPLAGPARVAHGDLSARNILWSLSPVPGVYVLDCDGAWVGAGLGGAASGAPPLRATTPNWEDPAVAPGEVPGEGSDRYALALSFLRVVGAANFPIQARQRSSERVAVDLELPRTWRKLPDMPELWELCERALSVANAADRPSPAEWAGQLEDLLDRLGAPAVAGSVRAAQGSPVASRPPTPEPYRPRATVADIVVRPVLRHRPPSAWKLISAQPPVLGPAMEPVGRAGVAAAPPLSARQLAGQGLSMWGRAHGLAARMARSPGRRAYGVRRLAGMVVLDLAAGCVGLFLVGMAVSPWIGL